MRVGSFSSFFLLLGLAPEARLRAAQAAEEEEDRCAHGWCVRGGCLSLARRRRAVLARFRSMPCERIGTAGSALTVLGRRPVRARIQKKASVLTTLASLKSGADAEGRTTPICRLQAPGTGIARRLQVVSRVSRLRHPFVPRESSCQRAARQGIEPRPRTPKKTWPRSRTPPQHQKHRPR